MKTQSEIHVVSDDRLAMLAAVQMMSKIGGAELGINEPGLIENYERRIAAMLRGIRRSQAEVLLDLSILGRPQMLQTLREMQLKPRGRFEREVVRTLLNKEEQGSWKHTKAKEAYQKLSALGPGVDILMENTRAKIAADLARNPNIHVLDRKLGNGGIGAVLGTYPNVRSERGSAFKVNRDSPEEAGENRPLYHQIEGFDEITNHPHLVHFVRALKIIGNLGDFNGENLYQFERLGPATQTLGQWLRQMKAEKRRITIGDLVHIIVEVAKGVDHLHQQGLVHRDVKPGNIWGDSDFKFIVAEDSKWKLGDYDTVRQNGTNFYEGQCAATHVYAGMEQIRNETVHPGNDVHAMASILYWEVMGGKVEGNQQECIAQVIQNLKEGRKIEGADSLAAVVNPAFGMNPENRPSITDFSAGLEAYLASGASELKIPLAEFVEIEPDTAPIELVDVVLTGSINEDVTVVPKAI